jgi:hypothetical protein
LPEHPEFIFMVQAALDRFHCTIGELREDYWLGRAWRALMADAAVQGRVARAGIADVLVLGPQRGPAPDHPAERAAWARRIVERIIADTAHDPRLLGVTLRFAEEPVEVAEGCVVSLLAQAVRVHPRWQNLGPWAADVEPVVIPVAYTASGVVAA